MGHRWLVAFGMVAVLVGCGDGGDDETATGSDSAEVSAPDDTQASTVATTSSTTTTLACNDEALSGGTVSTVGFDEITFGMTVSAAEQSSGVCLQADRDDIDECYYVVPVPGPEGISFLVTEGTIERVDVFGGDITTRSGLGIGTTETDVVAQFGGAVEVSPHPQGSGNVIVFVPRDEADADFRVVFETNGTSVTRFRSGRVPQVEDPLPCGGPAEIDPTVPPVSSE